MLKFFPLTVAVSAVFTFLPGIALSRPLSESSPYPVVSNSNAESLVCYIQTEDGKTINLDDLCKKSQLDSNTSSSRVSGQCYFVDSDGRPCKIALSESQIDSQTSRLQGDGR